MKLIVIFTENLLLQVELKKSKKRFIFFIKSLVVELEMEGAPVVTPEDVLESLMNDGTIDAMRLKIITQLKANVNSSILTPL